jgi:outer membrane protein W
MKKGLFHPFQALHCSLYEIILPKQELKLIFFFVAAMGLFMVSPIYAASESPSGISEFDDLFYPKKQAVEPDKVTSAPIELSDQYGLTLLFQRSHDEGNAVGLELRYRHFINTNWSLNLATGRVSGFSDGGVEVDLYPLEASFMFHHNLDNKAHAYAGAGIGYYFVHLDASELESQYTYLQYPQDALSPTGRSHRIEMDDEVGFIFFTGVEQQVNCNASFFCEIRYLVLDLKASANIAELNRGLIIPSSPTGEYDVGGIGLMIGIMWKF